VTHLSGEFFYRVQLLGAGSHDDENLCKALSHESFLIESNQALRPASSGTVDFFGATAVAVGFLKAFEEGASLFRFSSNTIMRPLKLPVHFLLAFIACCVSQNATTIGRPVPSNISTTILANSRSEVFASSATNIWVSHCKEYGINVTKQKDCLMNKREKIGLLNALKVQCLRRLGRALDSKINCVRQLDIHATATSR
jgi:hypothetical protein